MSDFVPMSDGRLDEIEMNLAMEIRRTDEQHRAEKCELIANLRHAREGLREIAKGEGAYSRDPLEHAANCIESMKDLARRYLPPEKPAS